MRASETARSGSFPTAAGMSRDSTELFPSFRPRSFPTDIRDGDRRELREPSAFAMDATPRASATVKKYDFLLPLLLAVRLSGYSGDRSRKLSRSGKEDRVVKGVGQHRHHRLGQRKDAGRILETAGSTSDLKGQSTVCLPSREIDAIASLRKVGLQLTPILKAKYARTGNT
jgi:hypothetical protein